MIHTLTFCYVSSVARDFVHLMDDRGQEIKLQIEADSKTAAIYDPQVESFCRDQGNDCRVKGVM